MKASVKFRDDQKPLLRAKVPLKILGFPFQSGIVAGESKELSLNLTTSFHSGPSFKMAYRPNDSLNPFSLVFKIGIGHLGSPNSSSMNMSAEFNLIGNQNPTFFLHFKPHFGDFTINKSQSSLFTKENKSADVVDKIPILPPESQVTSVMKGFFSGVEANAKTTVPVSNRVVANFRWGVRLPKEEEAKSNPTAGVSFQNFPILVMNKIGIERLAHDDVKSCSEVGSDLGLPKNDEMKRQLEGIQAENGMLRKNMEDLRLEILRGRKIDQRDNNKLSELHDFEGEGHIG